ncbi:hypothetical protein F5Y04DRAFT_285506 [Hypomontagnella monticulosa]|nr:hypothetical protein F5Y04DRAFT_285506 [Hypomontagnella monticulosa]
MGLLVFFASRFKFTVHIVQLILITLVIILSIVRFSMKEVPPQRAHIMGIAIGAKSTIFILYQVLTEHTQKFAKWASKKANFVLNCLDVPFWGAVMYMLFSANMQYCVGTTCAVSWVLASLALVLL